VIALGGAQVITGLVGKTPIPVNAIACGEPEALSLIVMLADAAPAYVGAKTTESVQFALAATPLPQRLVIVNSAASGPVMLRLLIVNAAVPALESVEVIAGLLVPVTWLPNDKLLGFNPNVGADAPASVNDICSVPIVRVADRDCKLVFASTEYSTEPG
jgi:hypothetical protein